MTERTPPDTGSPAEARAPGHASQTLAEVAVARPLPAPLTYSVPEGWQSSIAPGSRVLVPLGGGACEGIVTAVRPGPAPAGMRVRAISELLGDRPALTPELLELGEWLARHYVTTPGEALAVMLQPYRPPRTETLLRLVAGRTGRVRPGTHGEQVVRWLEERGGTATTEALREALGRAAAVAGSLVARGVLVRESRVLGAEPHLAARETGNAPFPELTAAQSSVSAEIARAIDSGEPSVHLIRGVTGSGKTEVYLRLARHVLEAGGGVLFLVPEISLTVPMISLFRERFGAALALFHSALTETERHREWVAARDGTARIIVGARSAVFAPVQGLRLIVLDEEPESSYKQHERPCYHARDVAIARGRIGRFPIVLGSATPSLESAHAAATGRYRLHLLSERFNRQPLPAVELIDMTEEFAERRNRSIFSWALKESLETTLAAGRQALLFVNRRGHSTYVFCRACGFVMECHQCSVALTFHQTAGLCRCHQCGYEVASPEACPACASKAFRFAGLGTQKVEEELAMNFPGVRVARMDSDTTAIRGSHQKFFQDFSSGRTQVLVGTQMVAKGFNFPSLDLVGVVNADTSLRLPDFRAAERTFQLVTQVAGRVGRAERPGRVLVQTFAPTHPALRHASRHDYEGFAAEELPIREQLFYPPFSALVLACAEAADEPEARQTLTRLGEELGAALEGRGRHQLLGPARAPVARIRGQHRFQLLVKLDPESEAPEAARRVLAAWQAPSGVATRLDVDPISMF